MLKSFVKFFITFGLVVAIIIALFEFFIMPAYVRHDLKRYVLDLRLKSVDRALREADAEGFKVVVYDTLYSNDYEPETVIDQFPKPGRMVKPGRTIRLKISLLEKMVLVPNLVGQSRRSAELTLQQLGLKIDTLYTEFNPDYPKGTVAWQFPKAGDQLKKGWGLQITISKGLPPDFYQVPQLFGLSLKKAKETLIKARLKVGKISYRQNEDLVPYTVLDQSITSGTVLDEPAQVDIVVSVLDLQDIFDQLTDQP
ncbi:MAG: PASTA domain-containing protein [Fidelibacterota bacterium]